MARGSEEDLHIDNLFASGNDEFRTPITTCCTSCKEDGQAVEAVRYCIDCEEYQCGKCRRFHDRYSDGHDVLGESMRKRWGEKKTDKLPTEKCQKHIGEVLQIYCVKHEELCCHVCVAMEHSACQGKKYIPDLAKNIASEVEYQTLNASFKDIVTQMNAILLPHAINKVNVDKSMERFDRYVEETREKLLDKFDCHAKEERKKVQIEHDEIIGKINSIITNGKELITEVQQLQNKIDPQKVTNKSQLFINVKNVAGKLKKIMESLQQISRHQPEDISFKSGRELAVLLDGKVNFVHHTIVNSMPMCPFDKRSILNLLEKLKGVGKPQYYGYHGRYMADYEWGYR